MNAFEIHYIPIWNEYSLLGLLIILTNKPTSFNSIKTNQLFFIVS